MSRALSTCTEIIFLFIYEPSLLKATETSAFHVRAVTTALEELDRKLRDSGHRLLVLHAEAGDAFRQLYTAWPFEMIFSHEEVGSHITYQRDLEVAAWCRATGVQFFEERQTGVFRRLPSRDDRARLWQNFMATDPLPAPGPGVLSRSLPAETPRIRSLSFAARRELATKTGPEGVGARIQKVTESAARDLLAGFLETRAENYFGGISSPNTAFRAGSRLSAHLAWGTISARTVHTALQRRLEELRGDKSDLAKRMRKSLNSFRSRIHWRDHFIQRLETEPSMEFNALNPAYETFPFEGNHHFDRWFHGETGLPLVDACIRCVRATGFLNFRMRCLMTSTAVHLLRIDWRTLLHPMARLWTDYEPGIHISQLQMQAGMVGINTLRIYNPAKQIIDQDPTCRFIKRWLPEVGDWTAEEIIAHQDAPRRDAGYLMPLIDYRDASKSMRSEYFAWKRRPETRELTKKTLERHGSRKRSTTSRSRANSGRTRGREA